MPDSTSAAPQPQPVPNEELVKVFDTEQETEAMVVKGLLDSAGIDADLRSIDATQETFPGVGGSMILVRKDNAAEAEKLIEDYRKQPPLDDDETAEITG
ncbi:MAG: hypothetical protein WAL71_07870 [Terriglobales bacterium]|jgi:hypothetical protein